MNSGEFEHILDQTVGILEQGARARVYDRDYLEPRAFEGKVLGVLRQVAGVEARRLPTTLTPFPTTRSTSSA